MAALPCLRSQLISRSYSHSPSPKPAQMCFVSVAKTLFILLPRFILPTLKKKSVIKKSSQPAQVGEEGELKNSTRLE